MRQILQRILIAGCLFVVTASAVRAEPSLTFASPGAVEPGKTTAVTLNGANLAAPLRVWTSFPAKIEMTAVEAAKATLSITVDASVQPGPGGILVAGADGVSEAVSLFVDDLPSVADSGANHSPEQAQEVAPLAAIDGASDGTAFDYYRFQAKAGQRIAFDVLAQRIGSAFDPFVRLLDAAGNELMRADDDEALGADCRFSHTFAADGVYTLELRDSKFAGGGRYRLRIGDFPLVATSLPAAAQPDQVRTFSFTGLDSADAASALIAMPTTPAIGATRIGAKLPGGQSSGWTETLIDEANQAIEAEPNNDAAQATKAMFPCGLSGRFDAAGDRDWFEFTGSAGQAIRLAGSARSLGSPAMVKIQLFNADGGKLAETPVNDADEWFVDTTLPAAGVYRVLVEDLLRRGGPEFGYFVSVRPGGSFELLLKNDAKTRDRFLVEVGAGACAIDLQVVRAGYAGPISLGLHDAPAGLRLVNPTIAAGANEHRLYVSADAGWTPEQLAVVRIVGRADQAPYRTVAARSADLLRTRTPYVPYAARWRDGLVLITGAAAADPFFAWKGPDSPAFFARPLGETATAVTIERKQAEFKDAAILLPDNFPPGFTAEVKPEGDKYNVTVKGPAAASVGELRLRWKTFGDFKGHGRFETLELPLQVIDPLALIVEPAGPLVQGQAVKVKIKLARAGNDPQPVTLKWQSLPAGVTGDEQIAVAADQAEIEVELKAAADAAVAKFDQLIVSGASKFAGKDFSAASPAASLEVKAP